VYGSASFRCALAFPLSSQRVGWRVVSFREAAFLPSPLPKTKPAAGSPFHSDGFSLLQMLSAPVRLSPISSCRKRLLRLFLCLTRQLTPQDYYGFFFLYLLFYFFHLLFVVSSPFLQTPSFFCPSWHQFMPKAPALLSQFPSSIEIFARQDCRLPYNYEPFFGAGPQGDWGWGSGGGVVGDERFFRSGG